VAREALGEILDRGNVPLPDKMFESRVFVSLDRLELQYGNALFKKLEDGEDADGGMGHSPNLARN